MTSEKRLGKITSAFNKPGFYIPFSASILALSFIFKEDIRYFAHEKIAQDQTHMILPVEKQTEAFKRNTAYHEAAHFVAVVAMNRPHMIPDSITMQPTHETAGLVSLKQDLAMMATSTKDIMAAIIMSYASVASDEYFFGEAHGGVISDVQQATHTATNMLPANMTDMFPMDYTYLATQGLLSPEEQQLSQNTVSSILMEGYEAARLVVATYADQIEILAEALLADEDFTMSYDEAIALLNYDPEQGLLFEDEEGNTLAVPNPVETFIASVRENAQPESDSKAEKRLAEHPQDEETLESLPAPDPTAN